MDTRKFSAGVIRPENLYDGPLMEKIINVFPHDTYNCLVAEFESGNQLYLWPNLARVLNKAWGYESDDWLNQDVELSLDHYTDKKTDPPTQKECIAIRAISPAKPDADSRAPMPALSKTTSNGGGGDMNDDIPFMCEWR